jgi:hypothetical protein
MKEKIALKEKINFKNILKQNQISTFCRDSNRIFVR